MLDFLMVSTKSEKRGSIEIYPKFIIRTSSDLMIRGGDFYAVWNEDEHLWSTSEEVALYLIDRELDRYAEEHKKDFSDNVRVMHMWDADSGSIDRWHKYCQKQCRDSFHPLDETLIFSNTEVNKKVYASKKLSYPLENCDISAYREISTTLYDPEELHKIEWAIGSIVVGDSKKLQKFIVMYGAAGTGKSTMLNIIQDLFEGYYSVFDAKALGQANNAFALESFRSNPLVAIQHDGDLSKIEDNTRLNSLVSHEKMTVNEKFKSTYSSTFNSFLFMGTNRPVRITDAKSGVIRRLIDVKPSGRKIPTARYRELMAKTKFELGGIAMHCAEVYREDPSFYDDYVPTAMMGSTNDFYNFVLDSFDKFKAEDGVSLKQAWEMYKTYCEEARVAYPYSRRLFRDELQNYFKDYQERVADEEGNLKTLNYFSGFISDKFQEMKPTKSKKNSLDISSCGWLVMDKTSSLYDDLCKDCKAQYATAYDTPKTAWANVESTLKDISTDKVHYVKPPENHIVIDFDLEDEQGNKCKEKNLAEASKWKPTYAEFSKSGSGVHLHYIYTGDPSKLARDYGDDIEIKVFTGGSSLRRRLTYCNDIPVTSIGSGLPLKEEKKTVNYTTIKSEKALRTLIKRNLNKEYMSGTKPSIDFIDKILNEYYESGKHYDVTDMRPAISSFAAGSTHHAGYCIEKVLSMKFKSEETSEPDKFDDDPDDIVFFDVEVFPNLFVIVWKKPGKDCVKMINPTANDVEELIKHKLIGFNNRRYDNHILYARLLGYSNEQLYDLSCRIINGSENAGFREAKNISYTDIYDFSSKKQSLKKFEIELGIHHQECGLPWDQPAPEDQWEMVADYCCNDVIATEAVFNARKDDYTARLILAAIAGMTPNDSTNNLTTKIIFGNERNPNLVYTDLATGEHTAPIEPLLGDIVEAFPGYEFVPANKSADGKRHNMYRGEDVGFGGYVYANPGVYQHVVTFDVASQHPHSLIAMGCFADKTKNFKDILDTRIAIKHKDYDTAKTLFDGKLAPYLNDPGAAKNLSKALKIAINSVYGLTSASFDNPFRDIRNVNNIVALRGALFMVNLKHEVQDRGFTVVHIKTDSIKVAEPSKEIFDFIMDYGKKYGYTFEIEHKFERICLVNNAVYIGKCEEDDPEMPGQWEATGTQFQIPYVYKTLFSHEDLAFEDLCETKEVSGGAAIYIGSDDQPRESYHFVGKVGEFCPMVPGTGGGKLWRVKDGKYGAVTGTKDYEWMESEIVQSLGKQDCIDISYYENLADEAKKSINEFCQKEGSPFRSFEEFAGY